MTSKRASLANERNAQASTGPRTLAGKGRSGQNARKHGLSAADPDPQLEAKVERLADLVAGEHVNDVAIREAARSVAEAQGQLQRVLALKIALLRSKTSGLEQTRETDSVSRVDISAELLFQLEGLTRYESRALSRRKFAVRRFNELVTLALNPNTNCSPARLCRD